MNTDKIKEYMRHKPECARVGPYIEPVTSKLKCTCGLDALLSDPGDEPPYNIDADEGSGFKTLLVHGPGVSRYCPTPQIADMVWSVANAAWKAGRSSLPQVTLDIEGEARKWMCRKFDVDFELNRNSDFAFTVQDVVSFYRHMLSVSAPAVQVQQGEGDTPSGSGLSGSPLRSGPEDGTSPTIPIANAWITLDDVKRAKGWSLGASLPEGTVLAYRRKAKPHHNWHYGVYVVNDDKARDQFRPHEVQLLEWPYPPPTQAPQP